VKAMDFRYLTAFYRRYRVNFGQFPIMIQTLPIIVKTFAKQHQWSVTSLPQQYIQ